MTAPCPPEGEDQPRRYFLGDEEIGEITYELLSRSDLGSQMAGRASLIMGRVLGEWAKNLNGSLKP